LIALVSVFSVGTILHVFRLPWGLELLAESVTIAAVAMSAVTALLKNRERRIRRRFQEIGYLNHHIRNALTVIEMAQNYAKKAEEREELIASSSLRIQLCLQKVSREEDLTDVRDVRRTSAKAMLRRAS
jgi:ABC-type multidrug transport system fused ATPase/permease subunit